jgi:large subunit ribosomal protein L2
VRAGGCYGQILKKAGNKALVKLPSGKKIVVGLNASATIGKLSNSKHRYNVYNKAGRIRWYGKTSVVRGVAMNPVDHPMGGKTHGKLHRTPWGKLAKGIKTARK